MNINITDGILVFLPSVSQVSPDQPFGQSHVPPPRHDPPLRQGGLHTMYIHKRNVDNEMRRT